ncbi:hypothetical protein BDR03DRAFT_970982 [Suillus americanus]|nr:hypothetical protein BDR03DRAFT_970982 [Suillus americanus]
MFARVVIKHGYQYLGVIETCVRSMIIYDGVIVVPNPEIPRTPQRSLIAKITNSSPVNLLRCSNIPRESLLCDFMKNFYLDPIGILGYRFVFLLKFMLNHFDQLDIIDSSLTLVMWCKRWIVVYQARIRSLYVPPSSPAHSLPSSNSMTVVSNDPIWWPLINASVNGSYFGVAASVGVMYDWALTLAQEVELIWRQRWSLMTFLYLSVRYAELAYIVMAILISVPTISMTDTSCLIINDALDWMGDVADVILGVIMITRLHAMYQRSRKVLIFLVVTFLAVRIANVVMATISTTLNSGEEFILSGTYQCMISHAGDSSSLSSTTWILGTAWEVLALCLAVWIAVKHFRELRQHSTSDVLGDCFTVLMKTHVSYFASFLAISCFQIGLFSPTLSADIYSPETQIYFGLAQIFEVVQLFVLGPRLILGVREYHAELVANSDTATAMTSIAFEERVHVSTSSSV